MKADFRMVAAAVVMTASVSAMALDYNFEGGVSWWDFDGDSAWGVDVTGYFDRVSTDRGPWAEAGYLSRASNLGIGYIRETGGDFDIINAQLELYLEGVYLAFGGSRFSNFFDIDTYGVRGGMMFGPTTRWTLGWDRIELPFGSDIDIFTIGAKHVELLDGGGAFNLEGEVGAATNGSSEFAYAVQADYYPFSQFGFGIRLSGIGSDDQWGLGSRYFFTPRLSGEVEWMRDDGDDLIQARVAARF